MIVRFALLIGMFFVAACAARQTEPGDEAASRPAMIAPLALEPPPVYGIIGFRDRLELSSQQVTALDSVATNARMANSILIDSLAERAITRNNSPMIQVNVPDRPLLQRIRDNNQLVLTDVAEILSTEQETEVCELYNQDEEPDAPRRPTRSPTQTNDAFRRGLEGDTAIVIRPFSVWPWCAAARVPSDSTARR